MITLKKTLSLAAVISATLAVSGVATSAFATEHEAATKTTKKAVKKATDRQLIRADEKHIKSDESRIANLEAEVGDLRAQLVTQKQAEEAQTAKQSQLEAAVAKEQAKEDSKNNLVAFRGGYASLATNRNNELLINNDATKYAANQSGNGNGWYVGGQFDWRVSDDFFGASDMVALDAELMFDYANFGNTNSALVSTLAGTAVKSQVTMLTLAASPKIKFNFLEGKLRPWIIPAGLAIQIVSPPSSGVTVLNPALQLGTGIEYNLWQNIWVGADFRYYFTGGDLNYGTTTGAHGVLPAGIPLGQTSTQGLVSGAYIGFGF
jgi:hypothetical protein